MIKVMSIVIMLIIITLSPGCSLIETDEEDLLLEDNLSVEEDLPDRLNNEDNLDETENDTGIGKNDGDEDSDGSETNNVGLLTLQKGSAAPFFELEKLGGGKVTLGDFCGVPIILLFWERDCHICLIALKALESIHRVDDVIKIYVVTQNAADDMESYLKEQDITIPVLIESDGVVFEDYKISATPTAVAIDRAGSVELVISGFINHESAKTLQRLLRKWVVDRVII